MNKKKKKIMLYTILVGLVVIAIILRALNIPRWIGISYVALFMVIGFFISREIRKEMLF